VTLFWSILDPQTPPPCVFWWHWRGRDILIFPKTSKKLTFFLWLTLPLSLNVVIGWRSPTHPPPRVSHLIWMAPYVNAYKFNFYEYLLNTVWNNTKNVLPIWICFSEQNTILGWVWGLILHLAQVRAPNILKTA